MSTLPMMGRALLLWVALMPAGAALAQEAPGPPLAPTQDEWGRLPPVPQVDPSLRGELQLANPSLGTLEVVLLDELGPAYQLERSRVELDGAMVFFGAKELGLIHLKKIPIHGATLSPGWHQLEVELLYRGVGPLASVRGFGFKVRSRVSFEVLPGQTMLLQVIAYELPGEPSRPRAIPSVRFESNLAP